MKFAFASLVAVAAAASISDLPACARQCIDPEVAKFNCGATDLPCICPHFDAIQASAAPCAIKTCTDSNDITKALKIASELCSGVKPPASSAPAQSSAAPASSAPAQSSAAPVSSAPAAHSSAPADCTTTAVKPTNGTTTAPVTVPTAGAAGVSVGMAAVVLAALAL